MTIHSFVLGDNILDLSEVRMLNGLGSNQVSQSDNTWSSGLETIRGVQRYFTKIT